MSKKDLENFKKRGFYLVDQFSKVGHDGELTLGENIGDLTGLTFAYDAAFSDRKSTKKEKKEFFVQYARLWCGKIRKVYVKTTQDRSTCFRLGEGESTSCSPGRLLRGILL